MDSNSEVYFETLDNYNDILYIRLRDYHSSLKGGMSPSLKVLKELWVYYIYLKSFESDNGYDFQDILKLNVLALNLNKL